MIPMQARTCAGPGIFGSRAILPNVAAASQPAARSSLTVPAKISPCASQSWRANSGRERHLRNVLTGISVISEACSKVRDDRSALIAMAVLRPNLAEFSLFPLIIAQSYLF